MAQHNCRSKCERNKDSGSRPTCHLVGPMLQEEQNTAQIKPDNSLWAARAFDSYDFITGNGWRLVLYIISSHPLSFPRPLFVMLSCSLMNTPCEES